MEFIRFDSHVFLFIAALTAVTALLYRRRNSYTSAQMRWAAVLRFVIIGLILTGLAGPQLLKLTNNKCVLFVVDISQSIHEKEKEDVRDYIRLKIEEKGKNDRIGVLLFGEEAHLVIPPSDLSRGALLSEVSRLMESHEAGQGFTDIEGALSVAIRLFPEGYQKKIVLITDGNENTGKASRLFDDLKSMFITVDVLPVGGVKHDEVLIESLYAPFEVRAGSPFTLEAAVSSNTATTGSLQFIVDGQNKGFLKDHFKIVPGHHQVYTFPVVIEKSGFHDISVRLVAGQDGFFINNSAEAVTFAAARPKVLFITDPALNNPRGPLKHFSNILKENSIDVDYLPADLLPAASKEFTGYNAVILNNVPSRFLLPEQMQALSFAVHDLGTGLVLVGGRRSIGTRGFAGTPVESALPVYLIPSSGKRPSSFDLVLLLDKSGSMSGGEADSKIQSAVDAIQSIIEMSGEKDRTGVIAFDSVPHVIANPESIKDREEILRKIQGIKPRGSTDVYPAFLMAYDWLKASDASHKHIILLSDGRTRERDFSELIRKMRDSKITISSIGIGKNSNVPLLKEIAQKGKGRFFDIENDFRDLSKIFRMDTLMSAGTLSVEEPFYPRLKDPDPILNGIPLRMPRMHGYMVASPKKTAIIPVVSRKGDPIVGFWRYGLGKAAVFTGDDGSSWSKDWVSWNGFGRLWVQMVKRTMQSGASTDKLPVFRVRGNRAEIQYEVTQKMKKPPTNITAKILHSDGTAFDLKLFRSSNGSYRGAIDNLAPGKYITVIAIDKPGGISDLARGGFLINGSREFLTLEKNKILLKGLTYHAGGRILTKDDPLFEDKGKRTKQFIPVWPYTFMLAVVLFLIYVAVCRINEIPRGRAARNSFD